MGRRARRGDGCGRRRRGSPTGSARPCGSEGDDRDGRRGASTVTRTGGQARRRVLLEEAVRQFGSKGYDGASLESVASACGVRKQTLLQYFPTKDAVFAARRRR